MVVEVEAGCDPGHLHAAIDEALELRRFANGFTIRTLAEEVGASEDDVWDALHRPTSADTAAA